MSQTIESVKRQHTPGPWRIGDAGRTVFGPPDGNLVPTMIAPCKSRENARLIAAAPELLRALQDLTKSIELAKLNVKKDFSILNAHACATKAIYKATGGAQ